MIDILIHFCVQFKAKVIEFKINHFKNRDILKYSFTTRMVTTANDCLSMKVGFLNLRDKFDKFIDKDEVGGPNDQYQLLGAKTDAVAELW